MPLSSEYQILIHLIQREIRPGVSIGAEDPHDKTILQQNKNIVRLLSDYSISQLQQLFKAAARQGLLAIVWDALGKLHAGPGCAEGTTRQNVAEQQKMRKLWISWELSVRHIEEVQRRQREALKELVGIFAESGIRVMVLKGLGLAQLYPRPSHRECGDLDIYLSGREDSFEKGNEVIRKMGIAVEYDGSKHSKFYYKGIPVENHKNFLNVNTTQVDKNLERELVLILQEQQCGSLELGGVSASIPPPDFQMIFLTRHAITHFLASGLVLRHLYDFGIFYAAHAHAIDLLRIEKILMRESQYTLYRAFLDVLHIYLGMPDMKMKAELSTGGRESGNSTGHLPVEQGRLAERVQKDDNPDDPEMRRLPVEQVRLAERVLEDIIENPTGGKGKVRVEGMWVPKRKVVGAVRLFRFRWKYKLVEKNAFGNRFWRAIGNCFRSLYKK
jgi:hypothetical protein